MNFMPHSALITRRHAVTALAVLLVHVAAVAWLLNLSHTSSVQTEVVEIEAAWIQQTAQVSAPASQPAVNKTVTRPTKTTTQAPPVKNNTPATQVQTNESTPAAATFATPGNVQAAAEAGAVAISSTSTPKTATVATAAEPKLELPSSSADYLNNPRPPYPPLSKRLGEQGKVVVKVFIETDGSASKAEIRTSSGYDRLDQTALKTVLQWRYVPGKRNGVPEAMWFNVPINFVLE